MDSYGVLKLMAKKQGLPNWWAGVLMSLFMSVLLGGLTSPVQASAHTQGPKKVLFIKVDFPDKQGDPITDAEAKAAIQRTFDFYKPVSYDSISLVSVTVTPVLRMPSSTAVYGADERLLLNDAHNAAAAQGFDYRAYDFDTLGFARLSYGWEGLAYVGGQSSWLNNNFNLNVVAHEIGHNLGLRHANFYFPTTNDPVGPGFDLDYADWFDTMGNGPSDIKAHFNVGSKSRIDWIPSSGTKTVTASGTYRIQEHDNPNAGGLRALRIASAYGSIDDGSPADYWLEYRRLFDNVWLRNGASIRLMGGGTANFPFNLTYLLDMSPLTGTSVATEREDSALVVGRTYSDTASKVHITPTRVIPGAINELEIVVNLGDYPGNGGPQVKITASATQTQVNTPVTFNAQATDPDGDTLAFYWDFGDRTFGTNAATATKSWPANGDYIVRCTVSDMKGGTGTASVAVKVGSPNSVRVSGRVLSPCGAPISGATVEVVSQNKTTTTNSDGTYTLTGLKPTLSM